MSEAHCGTKEDFDNHIKAIGTCTAQAGYEVSPVGFDAGKLLLPGMSMPGMLTRAADGKLSFEPDVISISSITVPNRNEPAPSVINGWGALDWKKEQRLIAEETKYQAEQQAKLQEEMDYANGKAKCLANPMAYGVGIILKDGTWISHEKAMELAYSKPNVSYRNAAGPGEIPLPVAVQGLITVFDLMLSQDRAAVKVYAECAEQAKLSAKHTGTITEHKHNPDGSESYTIEYPACLIPDKEVRSARDLLDEAITGILQKTGVPNNGIEKHVSGKDFLDVLVPVPPLVPETPVTDKFKKDLTDAGVCITGRQGGKTQMRGDWFHRKILPPLQITDEELDRSVPTNLPVDPTKDDPYQAFRRTYHLSDTEDAAKLYAAYTTGNFKGFPVPAYVGTPKTTDNPFDKAWFDAITPTLQRVDQDADCGAVIREEKKPDA